MNAFRLFHAVDQQHGEVHKVLSGSRNMSGFPALLVFTRDLEVHDSRDKVFGVLGLFFKYNETNELPTLLVPLIDH